MYKEATMKITISKNKKVLKSIELSDLQLKAIRLTGQKPEDYLADKLERIMDHAVNQAKQSIDRISPLTNGEMESMLDTLEAEKQDEKNPDRD
jgi:hypothetical protein